MIPVIDLLDGQAVHAVRGEREHYRPLKSVLCNSSDPLVVARVFRDQLRLNEIYIADLNAIQSFAQPRHLELINVLVNREEMTIILDAGVSDVENARAWLDLGVRKMVIGTETLRTWDTLQTLPAKLDRERLIFSLDFRAEKILSQCPVLASISPLEVLKHLQSAGWQEIILLDLRRVGSGEGVNRMLVAEARANFPDLGLLLGGGIANPEELTELESLGIAGVLVATALHRGIITVKHLSTLGQNRS